MGVVHVSGAAYAHPGGSELFRDVSFKVGDGRHVALVGANGVGKSTLLRCMAGELRATEGSTWVDAAVAQMPQAIGVGDDSATTVRELLVRCASAAVRHAGQTLAAAEAANELHHTEETGLALAEAVVAWIEVGGYEQEARWDATCTRVLRQPLYVAGAPSRLGR